ncbi:cupin domain-containing protein [Dictyobacter aurantiacus]|uniref:Cupin type-2 domain-containing protein n=1 Tax=Dictyobacter aurantiacus TaxID=1936993 RepID=A0A401ZK24_9CHLR|nr:cupin domain-containing protein [Dictyobacter aurantiacus]GCE07180.1 hypothetical protein KDAU_45090 [Dictyobacter aurantiacus]
MTAQHQSEQQQQQVVGATGDASGKMIVFKIKEPDNVPEEHPAVQILSDIGAARLVLFSFKAGQQLKEHKTSSQIIVQAIRGSIEFTANDSQTTLQAGMVLQLEMNVPHSIVAITDAQVLVTMVPSPSYHSLQREVFQNLQPLVTRTTEDIKREVQEGG